MLRLNIRINHGSHCGIFMVSLEIDYWFQLQKPTFGLQRPITRLQISSFFLRGVSIFRTPPKSTRHQDHDVMV